MKNAPIESNTHQLKNGWNDIRLQNSRSLEIFLSEMCVAHSVWRQKLFGARWINDIAPFFENIPILGKYFQSLSRLWFFLANNALVSPLRHIYLFWYALQKCVQNATDGPNVNFVTVAVLDYSFWYFLDSSEKLAPMSIIPRKYNQRPKYRLKFIKIDF